MNKYLNTLPSKPFLLTIAAALLSVASCTKGGGLDGVNGDVYIVNATGGGAQVVPASASTGTDTLRGIFDAGANALTYTMKWTALWTAPVKDTITKAIFYSAVAGQNGDSAKTVFIPAGKMLNATDSVTNSLSGNVGLSDKQRDDLIAGKWYCTIFTKRSPNGIVRAQLGAEKKY